jgi:PKHD-type hydroxylase
VPFLILPRQRPEWPTWAWKKDSFDPDERRRIVEMGEALAREPGTVGGDGPGVDEAWRISELSWIPWSPESDWIYQRLADVAQELNERYWQAELAGFAEDLQFTRYDGARQGHYDWHQDVGAGRLSIRKLSLVTLLCDGFEGGALELAADRGGPVPLEPGMTVVFPAYELHRVRPVTAGLRRSLVSWVSGPSWR